jgi:hypothetical protein
VIECVATDSVVTGIVPALATVALAAHAHNNAQRMIALDMKDVPRGL